MAALPLPVADPRSSRSRAGTASHLHRNACELGQVRDPPMASTALTYSKPIHSSPCLIRHWIRSGISTSRRRAMEAGGEDGGDIASVGRLGLLRPERCP